MLTMADGLSLLTIKERPDKYGGCPDLPHRLLALCDISADLGVSANDNTLLPFNFRSILIFRVAENKRGRKSQAFFWVAEN